VADVQLGSGGIEAFLDHERFVPGHGALELPLELVQRNDLVDPSLQDAQLFRGGNHDELLGDVCGSGSGAAS
jgi:hypothetical protein